MTKIIFGPAQFKDDTGTHMVVDINQFLHIKLASLFCFISELLAELVLIVLHFETLFYFFILIEFNIAGSHRFSRVGGWLYIGLDSSIRSVLFRSKLAFRLFRGFIGLIVALVLVRDLTLKIILKLSLRVNLAQDLTTLVIAISATFIHALIVILAIRLGTLLAYT